MASGVINGTTSNTKIISKIEWISEIVSDTESMVMAELWLKRTNTGYQTYGDGEFALKIGDQDFTIEDNYTIEDEWLFIMSATAFVEHDADGSKAITISASGSIQGTSLTSITCSGTAKLDAIPMAAVLNSLYCSDGYLTGTLTARYTPRNASLYTRMGILIYLNGSTHEIRMTDLGQKPSIQQTETLELTAEERNKIYSLVTNTHTVIVVVAVQTYSDSGYSEAVGNYSYRTVNLEFSPYDDIFPTLTVTKAPVNDGLPEKFKDIYIAGKSRVNVQLAAEAKYGAEITEYSIAVGDKSYVSDNAVSDILTASGFNVIESSVSDSREYGDMVHDEFLVYAYARPRIANVSEERTVVCVRCDSEGNPSENGTYLLIKAKKSYSTLNGINTCELRLRYCVSGGEMPDTWVTLLPRDSSSDWIETVLEGVVPSASAEYIVEIGIADDIEDGASIVFNIPTEGIFRHKRAGGKAVGYGKYVNRDNLFTTAWDMQIDGALLLGEDEEPVDDFVTEFHLAEDRPLYVGAVSQLSFRTDKEIPRSFFEGLTYSDNHAAVLAEVMNPYGGIEFIVSLDGTAMGGVGYALAITSTGMSGTLLYVTEAFDLSGTASWLKATEKGWQLYVTKGAYRVGAVEDVFSQINGEYVYIASDGWSFAKYHSGRLECVRRKAFSCVACSTAWGSLYTGSIPYEGLLYPEEAAFIDTPYVNVTEEVYGLPGWIYAVPPDAETDLKKGPPHYGVASAVNCTIPTVYLNYKVTGRWK